MILSRFFLYFHISLSIPQISNKYKAFLFLYTYFDFSCVAADRTIDFWIYPSYKSFLAKLSDMLATAEFYLSHQIPHGGNKYYDLEK